MTWNKFVFHDYGNSYTLISHLKSVMNKSFKKKKKKKQYDKKYLSIMLNQAKRRQPFYKKMHFIYLLSH